MKKFWRVESNLLDFIAPVDCKEIILPSSLIEPGFVLDIKSLDLRFKFKSRGETRPLGDFTAWRLGVLTLSQSAFEILKIFIQPSARCFSIKIGKYPFVICLIDAVHDAFDRKRSHFQRYREKEDFIGCDSALPGGSALRITKMYLKLEYNIIAHLFRLDGEYPLRLEIIVSNEFYMAYHDNKLTGLLFEPVFQ